MEAPYDPTDLIGQQRARQRTAEQKRREQQENVDDLRWLMGSKRGRRIVWRLLERTGMYRSSFTGNSETFFREGERNVGLYLMAQINEAGPDLYATMTKEQQERDRSNHSDGTT